LDSKLLDTVFGFIAILAGLVIVGFFAMFYMLGEGRNVGWFWLVFLFGVAAVFGGIRMIWRTWRPQVKETSND